MKRLDYQEETVERFAGYLEALVARRDKAERLAVIVGQVLADFRTGFSANPNVPLE